MKDIAVNTTNTKVKLLFNVHSQKMQYLHLNYGKAAITITTIITINVLH